VKPFLEDRGGFYVAHNATISMNVSIAEESSIWYGCVVRGDVAAIRIGRFTNVQDLTVIHPEHGVNVDIGDHVTIGHRAICHMKSLGSGSLVGMGAILMAYSVIGRECIIGAGALIPEGREIPDRSLVIGVPGKVVRTVTDAEASHLKEHAIEYARTARMHLLEPPAG